MNTAILILTIILSIVAGVSFVVGCIYKKRLFPVISIVLGMAVVLLSTYILCNFDNGEKEPQTKAFVVVTTYSDTTKKQTARSTRKDSGNEPESQDAKQATVNQADTINKVYITKNGSKYHYSYTCGKGDFYECTLQQAIERGLEPCKRCVK